MGRTCITHGRIWKLYEILAGIYEGKRPMGDVSTDFENNIKIERKLELDSSDWGPVTGSFETCNEPRGFVTHGKPHE
jgi:hypothetical protein